MDYQLLTGPIVGTVVGYCTNYIAVKMLFRPLNPVKIGSFTLPFTPGIIPKGKKRLAKALGEMIGTTLVTKDDFKKILVSDEVKMSLRKSIENYIEQNKEKDITLNDLCKTIVLDEKYNAVSATIKEKVTNKIMTSVKDCDLANVISDEIINAIKEKVAGSFLQMMVNDSLLESFKEPMKSKINDYIDTKGKDMVSEKVDSEFDNIMNRKLEDVLLLLEKHNISIPNLIISLYEKVLEDKIDGLLNKIDIKSIVEEKIVDMDMLELEKLIMTVMKKELNAIINLGALIGFVLGLITVFIK